MSASIVSGRGGGPSAIGVTVAQPERLSARRRLLSPPRINCLIALAALGHNDGIPVLRFVFPAVLHPPEDHCSQRAEKREGTGDHSPAPLFAGDLRNEIDDLLERPLRLVTGDDGRDGDGRAQHGRDDAQVGLPVIDDV